MRILIRYFFRGVRLVLTPFMLIGSALTKPKPVERDPEDQARVDEEAKSLALYHFPACPFCIKVRREVARLGIPLELRDAQHDADHKATLEREGGRPQVPCLRIAMEDGRVTWLYESDAINRYLHERFPPPADQ
ncbi:MAG: glutaredoxin family protein [Pseudomonadota bacterium]